MIAAYLLAPSVGAAQHHHRRHGHHRHHEEAVEAIPSPPSSDPAPVATAPSLSPPPPPPPVVEVPTRRAAPAVPSTGGCAYLGEAAPPDDAGRARWAQAREHHTLACRREASQPPDYNGALVEYQRSYDLYDGHPERYRFMGNVGRCEQALGQYEAALEAFQRFLAEAPADAPGRPRVEGMIGALEATLGTVTLTANVRGALVVVDNRELGTALDHVRVPMGRHVVELRASGYAPSRREVQLSAMETVPLRFSLEPLGRRGISPVFFWASAGVAVGAAVVGTVYGARALSLRGDVSARETSNDMRAQFSVTPEDGERLRSLSLTADVFFAGAALFGVGAAVLGFLTDFRHAPAEAPRTARGWIVLPMASQAGRGASLTVVF